MAEKALARNPKNYKAMFRRGKALGEQGFFERAEKILEELIKESPPGKLSLLRPLVACCGATTLPHPTHQNIICYSDAPAATAELKRLRIIDKEREKVQNQKLRGMYIHELSKVPPSLWASTGWLNRGGLETSATDVVEEVASPGTKESRATGTT
jgi:FK506-binding protein 8